MTLQFPAALDLDRFRPRTPWPQTIVLFTLLLATLVMPVSYRAGADQAHAHTIFQGLIDAIVGQPHHHHEPASEAAPATPFVPAAIPLTVHADLDTHYDAAAPVARPDPPAQLGLSTPISAFAAIQALGLLVATLLAGDGRRVLWDPSPHLLTRAIGVEIPPPRHG